jgi:hypothetical protein
MAKGDKLITPPFRVSFPAIWEPRGFDDQKPKYSVSAIFDPSTFTKADHAAFARMVELAEETAQAKFSKPHTHAMLKNPFRDGAEKAHLEGYGEGLIFCTLSTKMKPGVVGRDSKPLMDESELYAGCYARATITCYPYDNVGKGVAFGLHNLQKLGDGENLTGRMKAEDDFGDEAPEWEDVDPTGDDADDALLD